MSTPVISVVVPTRNRPYAVARLLEALVADTDRPDMELVIADDHSTPGSLGEVAHQPWPFRVRVVPAVGRGPAAARNTGARAANGRLLLFFDDDVEPLPGTTAAHVRAHASCTNVVGLGDLPPCVPDRSLFGITLRGWWEALLEDLRKPGHRFSYRNLLTGHFSIARADFDAIGGFDEAFWCHEDWELGYRALRHGLSMQFVPGATACHYELTTLDGALRRKEAEGVADVQLALRHPELTAALPLAFPLAPRHRLMRRLAWWPALGDVGAAGIQALLPLYEALNLRFRWRALLDLLLVYWYWKGVARVLSRQEVRALVTAEARSCRRHVTIDLQDGLDAAMQRLDALCPDVVTFRFGRWLLGRIDDRGREPLRGRHLRSLLAVRLRLPYEMALACEGVMPPLIAAAVLRSGVPLVEAADEWCGRDAVPLRAAPVDAT